MTSDLVPPRGDPAVEWQRSNPDIVVYVPQGKPLNDEDNEHFLVFEAPSGDMLAMWTQSSVEGRGDNHIVLARSVDDGRTWSAPQWIVGTHPGSDEPQASWGFPIVSRAGRIYCFFQWGLPRGDATQGHPMGCYYSDDDGRSWTPGADTILPRTPWDHPDPQSGPNWIVWQRPSRDPQGRWWVGYTLTTDMAVMSFKPRGWWEQESRCKFMRFDNIDDGPDPADLRITWLPEALEGVTVPHPIYPQASKAEEPSLVNLPDGRVFCTMRTLSGHVSYTLSEDSGLHWRTAEPLRYQDGGALVEQPISCCPIYALQDGRYLLLFHNNPGKLGPFDQSEAHWPVNYANYIRRPAFISVGEYRPDAHQPIWFSAPLQLMDTAGIPVGPKNTAEIATYTSLTERNGQRVLWYPDRKYFLFGKYLCDDLLAPLTVPDGA